MVHGPGNLLCVIVVKVGQTWFVKVENLCTCIGRFAAKGGVVSRVTEDIDLN